MFSTGQVIPVKKDLCSQTFTTTYHMICIYQVIPGASQKNPDLVTNSGPLLALRSGSGPSPEFRTLVVPLPKYWICLLSISHIGLETTFTSILEFTSLITFLAILSAPKPNALLAKQVFGTKSKKRKMMHCSYSTQCAEIFTFNFLFVSL